MSMDDVFGNQDEKPELPQGEPEEGYADQPEQSGQVDQSPEPAGTPPVPEHVAKRVPFAAYEAERKKRQEAELEIARYQEREKLQAERNPPAQAEPLSEVEQLRQDAVTNRFNVSERFARQQWKDLDAVAEIFLDAASKNPALKAQTYSHPDPWAFVYEEGTRLKFAAEIGNDPAAYRQRIRDERDAELSGNAPPSVNVPTSLASVRSTGARNTTFTGPTPFDEVFKRRTA